MTNILRFHGISSTQFSSLYSDILLLINIYFILCWTYTNSFVYKNKFSQVILITISAELLNAAGCDQTESMETMIPLKLFQSQGLHVVEHYLTFNQCEGHFLSMEEEN